MGWTTVGTAGSHDNKDCLTGVSRMKFSEIEYERDREVRTLLIYFLDRVPEDLFICAFSQCRQRAKDAMGETRLDGGDSSLD